MGVQSKIVSYQKSNFASNKLLRYRSEIFKAELKSNVKKN